MEIANLEHDIAAMRERLQRIERKSRWIWPFFWLICAAIAAPIAILAFKGEPLALGLATICGSALAVLAWCIRGVRLVDFASANFFPHGYRGPSHALFLEGQIADRQRRLGELRSRL
jgi:hypothetical protein